MASRGCIRRTRPTSRSLVAISRNLPVSPGAALQPALDANRAIGAHDVPKIRTCNTHDDNSGRIAKLANGKPLDDRTIGRIATRSHSHTCDS